MTERGARTAPWGALLASFQLGRCKFLLQMGRDRAPKATAATSRCTGRRALGPATKPWGDVGAAGGLQPPGAAMTLTSIARGAREAPRGLISSRLVGSRRQFRLTEPARALKWPRGQAARHAWLGHPRLCGSGTALTPCSEQPHPGELGPGPLAPGSASSPRCLRRSPADLEVLAARRLSGRHSSPFGN